MSLTIIHKLVMLTNGDIIGTAGDKASDKRMLLVHNVFPSLPLRDRLEIFAKTEFDDMRRELARSFVEASDQMLDAMAEQFIRDARGENSKYQDQQNKKAPPSYRDDDPRDWDPF